ncbi:PDDEXK nuclease domain-containing protein [Agrococcus sp. ARC_14]|uniref:PDDEXK nuclease domain-containing protein n=1 Tax=Agrococcus sp. ARC_14 TaxID=2919927 RepID=UPI001F05DBC7|nr:PDDEXK nuclease domain-containing protein [Agrococcus sp. ARC_14]MCH1882811.1 PDDEXK nuclease domain-containing protein [Agrococcus sp. ARC_14]
MHELELPDRYGEILAALKARVHSAHLRAQRIVNTELIGLYWHIGRTILEQQQAAGWGGKVVEQLAHDLRSEFPSMTGLSRSNLMYMRGFAAAWPEASAIVPQAVGHMVQQPVAQLPWGHIRLLLDKLDEREERDWYAQRAATEGWSRAVLEHNMLGQLRQREGAAPSSFDGKLEERDARLAQAISKDPYVFDFLGLSKDAAERELEQAMMDRIVDVLRELGPGWAFVDRQKHLEIDGDDFFIDLLFFHTEQLRYVVFELKAGKFKPEYTGQLGFYVAIVDDLIRKAQHAPTVGILLCSDKNESVVRYALGATSGPLAVSSYTYDNLPAAEQQALPDAERITHALDGIDGD